MIIQERKPGRELLYYRALSRRQELDQNNKKLLDIHERGYKGELTYDEVYDETLNHLHVFRGIYLKVNNSIIQCDALIVSDNGFMLHEIKNYSGNYTYADEKWFVRNFQISEDPLSQLKRSTSRLLKIKYSYNINFSIEGKIVFPNIDFSLTSDYDNLWKFTIMRNQLKSHLASFKDYPVTHKAAELVEIIKSHIVEDPFFNIRADFNHLKKGVYCRACGSYDMEKLKFHFRCSSCNHCDTIHTVILMAITDLNTLLNKEKITRKQVWMLLNGQVGLSTITRVLKKYCNIQNRGAWASYQFKYYDFEDAYKSESRVWRYKDSNVTIIN